MKLLLIAAMVSVSFPDEPSEDSCEESSSMREEIEREATLSDIFPSRKGVYVALRSINDAFLRSSPGCDNWLRFLQIMKRVVGSQESVTNVHEKLSVESEIVERFALYSFACEYDYDLTKANFDSRLACLDLVCQFDLMRTDTNAVMTIAEWLAGAQPITINDEILLKEYADARRIDYLAIFGGNKPPRYPSNLTGHHEIPPYARHISMRRVFQRKYNSSLPEFHRKAEERMRKFVFEEFKAKDEQERKALWAEFCRHAKFANP